MEDLYYSINSRRKFVAWLELGNDYIDAHLQWIFKLVSYPAGIKEFTTLNDFKNLKMNSLCNKIFYLAMHGGCKIGNPYPGLDHFYLFITLYTGNISYKYAKNSYFWNFHLSS